MAKGLLISLVLTCGWILAYLVVVHTFRLVRFFHTMTLLFALTLAAFPVVYAPARALPLEVRR